MKRSYVIGLFSAFALWLAGYLKIRHDSHPPPVSPYPYPVYASGSGYLFPASANPDYQLPGYACGGGFGFSYWLRRLYHPLFWMERVCFGRAYYVPGTLQLTPDP